LIPREYVFLTHLQLECGIALRKHAAIAPPGVEIRRFHVEHPPVEIAPAHARPPLDELVLLWIDDVDGQASSQRLEPFLAQAVDMDLEVSAGESYSDRLPKVFVRNIANNSELMGPLLEQVPKVPRSKGPAAAQEVDGFEKARLAGAVGAE
jgi:hypothetical protein